ncbi:MAG: T9SS type A sorting domain-containing protein, partial [Bacteroidia bacterium]|nr:T9SS type A sorting domain-containing protein [Bacteroidia bacterium]
NNLYVDNININGNLITSVEEDFSQLLQISPNPTSDFLEVQSLNLNGTATFTLWNLTGQKVIETTGNLEQKQQFSTASLPVGMYLLAVQTESGRKAVRKVLVQR